MSEPRLRVIPYVGKQLSYFPGLTAQSMVLMMVMAVVNLPMPLLQKLVVDTAIPAGHALPIVLLGIFAFFVRGTASAFQVLQNFVIWRVMSGIGHRLRMAMAERILHAPYARFVNGDMGGFVGRLSSDVQKVESMIFDTFRFIIRPIAMIVVLVLVMSWISWPATILVLAVAPLSVLCNIHFIGGLRELSQQVLAARQDLQHQVSEMLDQIRLIRCFNREQYFEKQVGERVEHYADVSVRQATREQLMQVIIELLGLGPWLILVCVGIHFIQSGDITLGDFLAFIAFERLLHSPIGQMAYFILHVKSDMPGPERCEEVMQLPDEKHQGQPLPQCTGEIALRDVSFSYQPDKPIFSDLNMKVQAGERIALVGPSGAGKSSLLQILLALYPIDTGVIRIDGHNVSDCQLGDIRRHIGVVFQDNPMFDGTIRSNILLGIEHIDDDHMWDALRRADAEDFVKSLPLGLETPIGVKGLKLSGGQRQRLAIARVLIKRPAIILLDEATSSLDSMSEFHIQQALDELLTGRTSITVAHRLSTIVRSDRICYMEKGRIIESGSHQELLARRGAYYQLYQLQVDGLLPE